MRNARVLRWSMLIVSGATLMQVGGCNIGDFLIRFAGAGAVVAGLRTIVAG